MPEQRQITGDSVLTSGKMTPKRQPPMFGLIKSQDITEQNSPMERAEIPQYTAPEGAYDEELKDFPEPLQTELQYLIDARVAKMVHKNIENHRHQIFVNIDEETERINAILNDRIKQNTNKVAEEQKLIRQGGRFDDSPTNKDIEEINDTFNPNAVPAAVPFARQQQPDLYGYRSFNNYSYEENNSRNMEDDMRARSTSPRNSRLR